MTRYVGFLRAINVGGHTVKMAALRQWFEAMDFTSVETFIASGNVIFESAINETDELERQIEARLHEALGYEVATFLRATPELTEIAQHRPFHALESEVGATLYVAFLKAEPSEALQGKVMALKNPVDDFCFDQRQLYWLRRSQYGESTFSGALLERTLRAEATVRNATTVRKIASKYA